MLYKVVKYRRLRWDGHVARMEETRNKYKIFVGKPVGERALGRLRRQKRITLRLTDGL
jgi:hypothetical protein